MKNRLLAVTAACCVPATTAVAGDALVWSTGNDFSDYAAVGTYLEDTGQFDSVDVYNQERVSGVDDPPPDVQPYDYILYYTNGSTSDPMQEANGDILYQFVQDGGQVVLAPFSWSSDPFGNKLAGDIIEQGLSPFAFDDSGSNEPYYDGTMNWNDGSALFDGVKTVGGGWRNSVSLTDGAELNATWDDDLPLVATKGSVIGINMIPDPALNLTGQYAELFANALTAAPAAAPPADLNGDGEVNVSDMLLLLGDWGDCPESARGEGACTADLNDDGAVNVSDLLQLLGEWG